MPFSNELLAAMAERTEHEPATRLQPAWEAYEAAFEKALGEMRGLLNPAELSRWPPHAIGALPRVETRGAGRKGG